MEIETKSEDQRRDPWIVHTMIGSKSQEVERIKTKTKKDHQV